MRVGLGSDHRGRAVKDAAAAWLRAHGHEVVDFGTRTEGACDYPDYAFPVAEGVAGGRLDRGVLVCGTGIGMSIAANKVAGVRAALVSSAAGAAQTRAHNDANVLVLAGDTTPPAQVGDIVAAFLNGPYEGGRHDRRLGKIRDYERGHAQKGEPPA
ncbi:MAG TPA: ribose 5-phosphate isomerase B [Candidatus Saccharimonadales bacterium]|nr:ribose 5-phosphate isomerase B [Candidatus Saccharimonadales bacterium]